MIRYYWSFFIISATALGQGFSVYNSDYYKIVNSKCRFFGKKLKSANVCYPQYTLVNIKSINLVDNSWLSIQTREAKNRIRFSYRNGSIFQRCQDFQFFGRPTDFWKFEKLTVD